MHILPQKLPSHNNKQLRIRFLDPLHRYHFNIWVALRIYYRIHSAQILWSNIENQVRYAIICASNLKNTLTQQSTTSNSISRPPARYHFNIWVAPRIYYRIYLAQISWSNIEKRVRYAIICASNLKNPPLLYDSSFLFL